MRHELLVQLEDDSAPRALKQKRKKPMQHASQRTHEHAESKGDRKGGVPGIAFADAVRMGRE